MAFHQVCLQVRFTGGNLFSTLKWLEKFYRRCFPGDQIQTHLVVSEKFSTDITIRHVFRVDLQKRDGIR